MKIWLGNLGMYNHGILIGKWISLPMQEEDLDAERFAICEVDGVDHEYFIADWECEIKGIVHEYANINELNYIAENLERLSEYDMQRLKYLIEEESYKFHEALERLEDVEVWQDSTIKDVAYDLVEQGCINIENYIDYDAIVRDLGFDGYTQINGNVFRLCH